MFGECWNAVLLGSSGIFSGLRNFPPIYHHHGGEWTMTESNCSFKWTTATVNICVQIIIVLLIKNQFISPLKIVICGHILFSENEGSADNEITGSKAETMNHAFVIKHCDSCRNTTHLFLFSCPTAGIQYAAADPLLGGTPRWTECKCVPAYVDPSGLSFILQIAWHSSTSVMRHRCVVTSCLARPPLVSVLQPACAVEGVSVWVSV